MLAVVLVGQAAANAVGYAVYPLYIKATYGWESTQYAYMLTVSDLATIAAIAAFPAVEARCGQYATAAAGFLLGGLSALLMVALPQSHDPLPLALHVVAAVTFSATTSFLEPCLKSVASLLLPQSYLGRSFGVLAMVASIGDIIGNLAGTQLYAMDAAAAKGETRETGETGEGIWITNGGGLPFFACSVMLFACAGVVWCVKHMSYVRTQATEHASPPDSPNRPGGTEGPAVVGLLPSFVGGTGVQRSVRHRPAGE